MLALQATEQQFETLKQWQLYGPDMGKQYYPKFTYPTQTYKEWRKVNPEGVVFAAG